MKANTKAAILFATVSTLILLSFMSGIFFYQVEKKESKYADETKLLKVKSAFDLKGLETVMDNGAKQTGN